MNILHVVDRINQRMAGGSAACPYYLSQAQAKLGHNVTIYTSDVEANEPTPEGVNLVTHKPRHIRGGYTVFPSLVFGAFKRFDIIHLHNFYTPINVVAASQGVPYLVESHGNAGPVFNPTRLESLLHRNKRDSLAREAGCCIANSDMEIDHYLKFGAKKIEVIPPGINPAEFGISLAKKSNGHKTILSLGRIDLNKGVDILLDAFAKLNRTDTQIIIAGVDYGVLGILKWQSKKLGIDDHVEFVGPLYGEAKTQAYQKADLFVMPSRSEVWGITFMEALACGTQVLITKNCGSASVLPVKCGRVVEAESESMAVAMGELLDTDTSYLKEYRRDWVSQFSWDSIAIRILRLYKEVLTDRCLKSVW